MEVVERVDVLINIHSVKSLFFDMKQHLWILRYKIDRIESFVLILIVSLITDARSKKAHSSLFPIEFHSMFKPMPTRIQRLTVHKGSI